VMNSTSIKEAAAVAYPRDKMYGVWWAGAEPDVRPAGDGAKGYNALVFMAPAGQGQVHQDILKFVHDRGQGTGDRKEVGEVLYNRGLTGAMMAVEGVKRAQLKYGKKPLTGEQVQWGLENLALDQKALAALGFAGFADVISTSCVDHEGGSAARVQQWDGTHWVVGKETYVADQQVIKPMIRASAQKYAQEKKLTVRDCAKELASAK
jgi:branched-chain amino acid transport system substrate-binding protein